MTNPSNIPPGSQWRIRLSCCGRDDGVLYAKTWEEADQMREDYTSGPGVHENGYSAPEHASAHRRAAIVESLAPTPPAEAQAEPVDERADFERDWAKTYRFGGALVRWDDGSYANINANFAWAAWQARAALSTPAQPAQAQAQGEAVEARQTIDSLMIESRGRNNYHVEIDAMAEVTVSTMSHDPAEMLLATIAEALLNLRAKATPPVPPAVEPDTAEYMGLPFVEAKARILEMPQDVAQQFAISLLIQNGILKKYEPALFSAAAAPQPRPAVKERSNG